MLVGYIPVLTHNRPTFLVTDAWPYTEPTEILQKNKNKSISIRLVSDEPTQSSILLLHNKKQNNSNRKKRIATGYVRVETSWLRCTIPVLNQFKLPFLRVFSNPSLETFK